MAGPDGGRDDVDDGVHRPHLVEMNLPGATPWIFPSASASLEKTAMLRAFTSAVSLLRSISRRMPDQLRLGWLFPATTWNRAARIP